MSNMTKRVLADALKKMVEKKPLSRITVTDLAEECGINRHTFYYHFKDIYDLLEWIYVNEVEKAIMEDGIPQNWEEWFRRFFSYAQKNKRLIMSAYESVQKDYLLRFMYRYSVRIVSHVIDDLAEDLRLSPKQSKFIIDFYAYAFEGIIFSWIGEGMKQDPEELIKMLGAVMREDGRDSVFRIMETQLS